MSFDVSYQVRFINPRTGDTIRLIPGSETFNLRYSRVLDGIGKFTMVLDTGATDWFEILPLDTLVDIQRRNVITGDMETEDTYFLRTRERFSDNASDRVSLSGVHINHLLKRRIIDPDDDPQAAGGYSTKTGNAGDVIREYVREQAGDLSSRPFPDFVVPAPATVGDLVGADLRYENLLTQVQNLAKRGNVNFVIRRTVGNGTEMIIDVIGDDRSVETQGFPPYLVFDPARGNVESPRLTDNRQKEKTFVYALGEGEGSNRDVLKIAGEFSGDSPFNRIEFKKDARNGSKGDTLNLLTQGVSALLDNRPQTEFSFDFIPNSPGGTYRVNWNLGDTATVQWGKFRRTLQITEIDIRISGNDERIQPKVKYL